MKFSQLRDFWFYNFSFRCKFGFLYFFYEWFKNPFCDCLHGFFYLFVLYDAFAVCFFLWYVLFILKNRLINSHFWVFLYAWYLCCMFVFFHLCFFHFFLCCVYRIVSAVRFICFLLCFCFFPLRFYLTTIDSNESCGRFVTIYNESIF